MSWKCFFSHKWKYLKEDVEFVRIGGIKVGRESITILSEVRLCKRCYKKQLKRVTDWVSYNNLTTEQERDKKINELGI